MFDLARLQAAPPLDVRRSPSSELRRVTSFRNASRSACTSLVAAETALALSRAASLVVFEGLDIYLLHCCREYSLGRQSEASGKFFPRKLATRFGRAHRKRVTV